MTQHGAQSAPKITYNFPGSICISLNDEAAHGVPGSRKIRPGDLVNIDVSAELGGYFADTSTTMIVPPVSPTKKRLVDCARLARERAVAAAQAGQRLNAIGWAAETQARRCGFNVIRDLTGHGIGRRLHDEPRDVPGFFTRQATQRLREGLVITVEPFLSAGSGRVVTDANGWTIRTADGGLSAQFEHTIVVTRGKPIVLTAM
jgi:methionyl aminopeptidase